MKILKKRLDGGHKKLFIFIFFSIFIICRSSYSSQILDFETEIFIKSIISEIKSVNKIDNQINFKILSNKDINAFVDERNIIYITSGLIENCKDYIALLAVIAHEIGHIDNNHIEQRKFNINKFQNLNSLSSLSVIAGSLISNNPEFLKGIVLSSATSSGLYINFSKDQEREADYYSIETLKKLNLYSDSIIELLKTIEKKSVAKGITKEQIKKSTHPHFAERIDIINYSNENDIIKIDKERNRSFLFIQAKFLGYNKNDELIIKLDDPFKSYANSIIRANKGDLKYSMMELNKLIKLDNRNYFLLETKADILFSYGYTDESIKFYEMIVKKLPNNNYAKIRIFENKDLNNLNDYQLNELFVNNLNLLKKYYNNQNILIKYIKLSKLNKKNEWQRFLEYWLNKNDSSDVVKKKLNDFKGTNDKNLLDLIKIIYSRIK